MIFSFVSFFERSMLISIKIPTGSIQDKEIEYFTFSYLHGSFLWFHCGFWGVAKQRLYDHGYGTMIDRPYKFVVYIWCKLVQLNKADDVYIS
jgi:hypothetical protein